MVHLDYCRAVRRLKQGAWLGLVSLFLLICGAVVQADRLPNIVFILCDDLGYGDIGANGQKKIKTPNIDRIAREGMNLTAHYSGSNVCAPSRCVLMSGKHPGYAYIRDNRGGLDGAEGQEPVPQGELTLPLTLKSLGYRIGGFGKWGLGPVGSSGDPLKQGFDRFFGYNCQAVAHNFYPTHLWSDSTRIELGNPKFAANQKLPPNADPLSPASYAPYVGKVYAPDLIAEEARKFLKENKDQPFFLYFATTVPHLALQVPEDSLNEYQGVFEDSPYIGDRSYLPHRTPRAAYAAMITRLDKEIGTLLDLLKANNLEKDTIVIFTSDNGPLFNRLGGTDADFFGSAAKFRGRKGSFYEGGFRVPCLVRWKGRIKPKTSSDFVSGFEDWLPTLTELLGKKVEASGGGISIASTLLGKPQAPRRFLYRESPGYGGQQSVRVGKWKGIRTNLNPRANARNQTSGELELYDLEKDPSESTNVANSNPEVVAKLETILKQERQKSALFPIRALDNP